MKRLIGGGRSAAGFTLLELAVVVAAIGLLLAVIGSRYGGMTARTDRDSALQHAQAVQSATRAFVQSQARLPCPADPASAGAQEDCGRDTGRFPYETLGLTVPDDALRATYSVYRNPANDADLTVARDRSGSGRVDAADLIIALNAGPAPGSVDTTRARITGDDGINACSSGFERNVAYFLVVPLDDRNGNGSRLDGEGASLCALSPAHPATSVNDDVVLAEGFGSLAGWLSRGSAGLHVDAGP